MTAKELREKRANLINQAGELLKRAESENRNMTAEEDANWQKYHADADELKVQYERMEKQADLESELHQSQGRVAGGRQSAEVEATPDERNAAFGEWMRFGVNGLSAEHYDIMAGNRAAAPREARAQSVAVDTAGGYLVADEMAKKIETAMAAYAGVRNTRATVMRTNTGADILMPTSNDTTNSGTLIGENVQHSEKAITVGSKTLRAYAFSSGIVLVSYQFLQDASVPQIENWISGLLAERNGRGSGAYFITGTGNNQPEGLASAATSGVTATSATEIIWDELVDLEHSVDPAYRLRAEWLLADGAVKVIKKLKDGEGRPLWVPGVATKEPDTILGYRYAIDQSIPTPASGTISAYFGDFSKFVIRDVAGMQMLRLTERYADYGQVAFLLFSRHDSMLLDAGTHPIKYLTMGA